MRYLILIAAVVGLTACGTLFDAAADKAADVYVKYCDGTTPEARKLALDEFNAAIAARGYAPIQAFDCDGDGNPDFI